MDQELITIGAIVKDLKEVEKRLFTISNKMGPPAKRRACKYLLNRFEGLFDWMKEE